MKTTQEIKKAPTDKLCATASHASLQSLLHSGDLSDMTIKCRDREFKTHRAIVCTQSPFFKTALRGNFKEGTSGIVDLSDDDPEIVQRFLDFLYTGSYSDDGFDWNRMLGTVKAANKEIRKRLGYPTDSTNSTTFDSLAQSPPRKVRRIEPPLTEDDLPDPLKILAVEGAEAEKKKLLKWTAIKQSVEIYILADKYDVPPLRLLARDRFFEVGKDIFVDSTWCPSDSTDIFSDLTRRIYKNTGPGKDPLRQALHKLISLKVKVKDDVLKRRMREEMMANAELAVGVVDYLYSRRETF